MRLFWKLFCSMVAMTALACSISGFLLIDGQFRSGLDAQAEIAVTEHTILRRMLLREMQFSRSFSHADVARLAEDSAASLSRGGISFRLSREDGQTLSGIARRHIGTDLLPVADAAGMGGSAGREPVLPAHSKSPGGGGRNALSGDLAGRGRSLLRQAGPVQRIFLPAAGADPGLGAGRSGCQRLDHPPLGAAVRGSAGRWAAGELVPGG